MSILPIVAEGQEIELRLPPDFTPAFATPACGEIGNAILRLANRLLETTEALMLVLDPDGRVLRMNPACQQFSGFKACDVVGHKFWDALASVQDRPMFRHVFGQVKQQRDPVRVEAILRTAEPQSRYVAWSLAAVIGADGACEAVLATGIDVTRRCRAEEQVRTLKQQMSLQMPGDGNREGRSEIVISDRRTQSRQSYPYYQLIAPIVDGVLPRRSEFQHVRCIDISPGGLSFVSPTPPTTDAFVVALGNPPDLVYVRVSVAHVRRLDESGDQGYSIGCNYIGRVE